MKPLALITASILGLTFGASAQTAADSTTKAPAAAATKAAAKVDKAAAKTDKAATTAKAAEPLPMHSKVDTIDTTGKSFTHTTQKGTKVTNKVTSTTVIMQGDKPAQFSDIKVGDYVSGTHLKKSDTEYEIVKITKFGPETPKADKKTPAKKP